MVSRLPRAITVSSNGGMECRQQHPIVKALRPRASFWTAMSVVCVCVFVVRACSLQGVRCVNGCAAVHSTSRFRTGLPHAGPQVASFHAWRQLSGMPPSAPVCLVLTLGSRGIPARSHRKLALTSCMFADALYHTFVLGPSPTPEGASFPRFDSRRGVWVSRATCSAHGSCPDSGRHCAPQVSSSSRMINPGGRSSHASGPVCPAPSHGTSSSAHPSRYPKYWVLSAPVSSSSSSSTPATHFLPPALVFSLGHRAAVLIPHTCDTCPRSALPHPGSTSSRSGPCSRLSPCLFLPPWGSRRCTLRRTCHRTLPRGVRHFIDNHWNRVVPPLFNIVLHGCINRHHGCPFGIASYCLSARASILPYHHPFPCLNEEPTVVDLAFGGAFRMRLMRFGVCCRRVDSLDQWSQRLQAVFAWRAVDDRVGFGACLRTYELTRVDVLRKPGRAHDFA